jgi:hypothetical protein
MYIYRINYIMLFLLCTMMWISCSTTKRYEVNAETKNDIIKSADELINVSPSSITKHIATRSAGGIHDYFSEGPYWWPDPADPNGPYIRDDGKRNPDNFVKHSASTTLFNKSVTILAAAYILTKDKKYANKTIEHLKAWFIDTATMMNPHLLYSQAIKGINTGRGIGIIDGIRFIEVALAIKLLIKDNLILQSDADKILKWYNDLGNWMVTHPYGHEERDNNNNHSTWWGAQIAVYGFISNNNSLIQQAKNQYKKQLDIQMADNGSFPDELSRTKPFHYELYNLNAWTILAATLDHLGHKVSKYESKNGSLQKAINFIIPFYQNPSSWKNQTELEPKIETYAEPFLYLASSLYQKDNYNQLWHMAEKENDVYSHSQMIIFKSNFK